MEKKPPARSLNMLRPIRIRDYLLIMNAMGIAGDKILEGTGIVPLQLKDADYLIDSDQCRTVIGNMIRLTGDSGIGLAIGGKTDLLSLGITAYAMTTCRILRETLEVWGQYSGPLLGMMSRLEFGEDENGDGILTIVEPTPESPIFVFCVEELISMAFQNGKVMSGVLPEFKRMELPYPAPAHRARYETLFKCPIQFDAKQARVIIAKQWLDLPLLANDDKFHKICLEHCTQILHRIKHSSPTTSRLREAFLASPRSIPDLDTAARLLHMSSRTLKRRLQDEGHSYQSLTRDFRADLAREYLLSTRMAAKEIAYLLGFEDVHYFRRAFKTWTGQTVNEYRATAPCES